MVVQTSNREASDIEGETPCVTFFAFSLPVPGRVAEPKGRSRVGAARLFRRRAPDHRALPTRSLRDHPPRDGEGEASLYANLFAIRTNRPVSKAPEIRLATMTDQTRPFTPMRCARNQPRGIMIRP
ncbi:hypothetical protein D3C73_881850 [compost metagenome]